MGVGSEMIVACGCQNRRRVLPHLSTTGILAAGYDPQTIDACGHAEGLIVDGSWSGLASIGMSLFTMLSDGRHYSDSYLRQRHALRQLKLYRAEPEAVMPPADVVQFVESTFKILRQTLSCAAYHDERLSLSPAEAELWSLELDELERLFDGQTCVDYVSLQCFLFDVLPGHDQADADHRSAPTGDEVQQALDGVRSACAASVRTGNPLQLYL